MSNVPAPFEEREPALPARPADPREERLARQPPDIRERTGELLGRVVATAETSFAVGRHECDEVDVGTRQPLGDDARRLGAEPAETALLPAANDPANVGVVRDRCPRRREGEPPARALAAARDRPRRRRAAARAQRRRQRRQPCAARRAEKRSCGVTDEAAPREQQVEHTADATARPVSPISRLLRARRPTLQTLRARCRSSGGRDRTEQRGRPAMRSRPRPGARGTSERTPQVLAEAAVEQQRDELRERVRVRVEADVDEVRDVRPPERVSLGHQERIAVVLGVLLDPQLAQPLGAEREAFRAQAVGALLEAASTVWR